MLKKHQLEDLHIMACKGFVYYQNEDKEIGIRFEDVEGKENTTKGFYKNGTMFFYEDKLSALLCFNHFSKKYPYTLMLWDMAENPTGHYCVLVNKPFGLLK